MQSREGVKKTWVRSPNAKREFEAGGRIRGDNAEGGERSGLANDGGQENSTQRWQGGWEAGAGSKHVYSANERVGRRSLDDLHAGLKAVRTVTHSPVRRPRSKSSAEAGHHGMVLPHGTPR